VRRPFVAVFEVIGNQHRFLVPRRFAASAVVRKIQRSVLDYSVRKAINGSIRVARRAGR